MLDEPEEGKTPGHENIRRVYALPAEMVERITKYQNSKGLSSEVEAVRRLLDEALKSRDDVDDIINRLLAKLGQTKIAAEAARDVLVGHPLVTGIGFGDNYVTFHLKSGTHATVHEKGFVSLNGKSENWMFDDDANPYAGGSSMPF